MNKYHFRACVPSQGNSGMRAEPRTRAGSDCSFIGVVGLHTHKLGIVTVAVSCVPSSPLERKNENKRRGAVLKTRPRVLIRAGPYLIINQGHDITNGGFRQTKPLEELFVVVKRSRVLPLSHSVRSSVHCGFLFLNSLLNFERWRGLQYMYSSVTDMHTACSPQRAHC